MIIAHRGASAYAPGNTLRSFQKAIELGADMIEFDVRRTKDNILIAHHDWIIENKTISELTYQDILGRQQDRQVSVPTFEAVLNLAKGRIRIDVDVKEEGYENEVIKLILKHFNEDGFIVTSYNDASLKRIKTDYPFVRAGLILGRPKPKPYLRTRISELFCMRRCHKARADFLVPHFKLLRFGFLRRAERDSKPVYVWTVNEEKEILACLQNRRIEAIITDRPDSAIAIRDIRFGTHDRPARERQPHAPGPSKDGDIH